MPTEVYLEYLRQQFASQKSLYDYLQLILPIASGSILAIAGWVFAFMQNNQSTRFQLKKEQYYRSRESMTKIVTLYSEYLVFIYNFIKNMKNTFNSVNKLDTDFLNDFITEGQMKLAYIHQLIRIEFPFQDTGSDKISLEVKNIENAFVELFKINESVLMNGMKSDFSEINKSINELQKRTDDSVKNITRFITEVEIEIIRSLDDEAVKMKVVNPKEITNKIKHDKRTRKIHPMEEKVEEMVK